MEKLKDMIIKNRSAIVVLIIMMIAALIYRYTNNVLINLVICIGAVGGYVWFLKHKWDK
ncbi:MAG: hypothetical protein SPL49_00400 [Oribacterium sp.]|jgi:xanthine/uracil permease|nr:hypothetical protein [Oribacterium sp.]MDY6315676.1 hypothetical protein [Oribacterium sp.]